MLACSSIKHGPRDGIERLEMPTPTSTSAPKATKFLIRVYTTTVNAIDRRARSLTMPKGLGLMKRPEFGIAGPRQLTLGTEFSGVVE